MTQCSHQRAVEHHQYKSLIPRLDQGHLFTERVPCPDCALPVTLIPQYSRPVPHLLVVTDDYAITADFAFYGGQLYQTVQTEPRTYPPPYEREVGG